MEVFQSVHTVNVCVHVCVADTLVVDTVMPVYVCMVDTVC